MIHKDKKHHPISYELTLSTSTKTMKPNHKQTYQINNPNPIQIDLIHIHANQSSETSDHVEQGIDLTE